MTNDDIERLERNLVAAFDRVKKSTGKSAGGASPLPGVLDVLRASASLVPGDGQPQASVLVVVPTPRVSAGGACHGSHPS